MDKKKIISLIPEEEDTLRTIMEETDYPIETFMEWVGWPTDQWHWDALGIITGKSYYELKEELEPSYNIAPSQLAPVLTADDPHIIDIMHFGLVPFWAKDVKVGPTEKFLPLLAYGHFGTILREGIIILFQLLPRPLTC